MAFLGPNDILVTEKETGKVVHVINGQIRDDPALDVAVANSIERGLLGIAISKQPRWKNLCVSYLTQNLETMKMEATVEDDVDPAGNRLYQL